MADVVFSSGLLTGEGGDRVNDLEMLALEQVLVAGLCAASRM